MIETTEQYERAEEAVAKLKGSCWQLGGPIQQRRTRLYPLPFCVNYKNGSGTSSAI